MVKCSKPALSTHKHHKPFNQTENWTWPPRLNFLMEAHLSPGEIFQPFAHNWKDLLGSYTVGTDIAIGRLHVLNKRKYSVQMHSYSLLFGL